MAKVTITFESASGLPSGPLALPYSVSDTFAPDLVAAIAGHPVYGHVAEQIMADTGQVDASGAPILGPATQMRASTFAEGLTMWADANVRDVILGAVNQFRVEKAKAVALAKVNVAPVVLVES